MMPVKKYRSIEDMPGVPRRQPGDPALARTIRQLWDFARRASRHRFRPGVYKFRSIEDMHAASDAYRLPEGPAGPARRP
ncbi:MAG: hypothetical protein ACT4QD_00460 [Acidobacteriota bacterium]